MSRLKALIPLLLLCAAACHGGSDERPPVVPEPVGGGVSHATVRPEIEKFFRENPPASGTRLMAGDRIAITVQGKPELTVSRDVPPNGEIPILRADKSVNTIKALGKTAQALEVEIAKIHSADFEHPFVTVTIETTAPRAIFVLGAVMTQGAFPVSGNDRLTVLQALALAGGTTAQSDLHAVTIQRNHPDSGESVTSPPLDLQKAVDQGDQRDNLNVEPGDTIVVPDLQQSSVQVLGQVVKPGPVVWRKGLTLIQAINEAGSFARWAKKTKIKVVRNGLETFFVNFDEILDGTIADPVLQPRDVVWVDEKWF